MKKIFLYGIRSERNFGGPSLMHGVREIIDGLYSDYQIVCYQATDVEDIAVNDMGFPVRKIPYKTFAGVLIAGILYRIGIRPFIRKDRVLFFKDLASSDLVANLFGICFCSNFESGKYLYLKAVKRVLRPFAISVLAKLYGKKTVKCTSSYGPVISRNDLVSARLASRWVFDVMYARERESQRQMVQVAGVKKNIAVAPDMAALMPYIPNGRERSVIGLSVSYQIIRQWKSKEGYIDCMVSLVKHVLAATECDVLLIPNEVVPEFSYHDVHVAEDILQQLDVHDRVQIPDVAGMNSTELKSVIGDCSLLVGSRYHSCVAALSMGIPVLVIGWHYKYAELLELYGQDNWLISCADCTNDALLAMFDSLWSRREQERDVIMARREDVFAQIAESGRIMFEI